MAVEILAPLGLALAALAYYRRCATLDGRGKPVALWRRLSFAGSILLLAAADLPPASTVAEELVVAHMAQHLLVADLAALLFCLGLTGPVLQPVLALRGLGWLRAFGNPLVAFPVWMLSLYLWHLGFLYQGVLESSLLHVAQHACFFGFGLAMWMPLVGPLPTPGWFNDIAKLGYVIAVRFSGAVLANVFIWSGSVLYPDYAPGEREWGIGALADQGAAGNLMMIETGAVTIGLFAWLFFRAASRGVEKQELLDLADRHGVALDEARAARAVAAGQGKALRDRILGSGEAHPDRMSADALSVELDEGNVSSAEAPSNFFLYVLVFVVGTGSLGAEIAAVRLMAPFFGASTIIWANTIGVVLVALSVGYWLGGRLGDRRPDLRSLCLMVMGAAVLLAIVPLVARPFLDISVDALDRIEAGAFVGSLIGVLFLIAIPIVMLGTCSPWAIRLAVPDVEHAGRVAGRLYAISTVGSLLGTLVAALALIPLIGTQRTFLVFASVIALVAAVGLGWRFAAVPIALIAAIALPVGTVKATDDGEVIYETETEHQYVRVIEQPDGDRVLELNEGQAVHSIYRSDTVLTDGVWDGYLVLPFVGLSEPPEGIAILGNAAGTTARAYGRYFPATEIDGVEIDPELEEVGRRFFDMGSAGNLTVHNEDARPWLRRAEGGYDVIMVDAYRQPYIPFYLATREFFELVRDRLAPGGVVIVNAGHPEGNDDLETVLGSTMDEAFPGVLRYPIEKTNTLLVASEGPISGTNLLERLRELPPELQTIGASAGERVGPRLPGSEVYTDDKAPVEWLIDRSILGYASDE